SMGGYVALMLETASPGTLAGIVTLGTKFAWSPALALRETARLDPKIIAEKVPKFAAVLTERHAAAGGWELVLDRTGKILAGLGDGPLLTQRSLSHVQARVCVAVGDKDDTVSAEEAREYAAFIPSASSEVLPDTPHPIERVSPDAIVALMSKVMN
ncbi:MAG: alpha/beta fold hydrolase, partial [Gemmatimonas sp.]